MKIKMNYVLLVCMALLVSFSVVDFEAEAINKVTTLPATNITATSATLNARVEPDGSGVVVYFSVYWSDPQTIVYWASCEVNVNKGVKTTTTVSCTATGLKPGTKYKYKTSTLSYMGPAEGGWVTFTTLTGTKTGTIVPLTIAPPSTKTGTIVPLTIAPPSTTPSPGGSFPPPPTPAPPGLTPPPPTPGSPGGTVPPPVPGGTPGLATPMPLPQCPGPQPPPQPTQFPSPPLLPPQPGQPEPFMPQGPQVGTQSMMLYISMGIIGLLLIILIVLIVVMMSKRKRPPKIYSSR